MRVTNGQGNHSFDSMAYTSGGWAYSAAVGSAYSTVAHFNESADEWPAVAWSIVLEFLEPFKSKALVRFLMPNAPDHLLKMGAHFDLYEGPNLVAHAEVIEGE